MIYLSSDDDLSSAAVIRHFIEDSSGYRDIFRCKIILWLHHVSTYTLFSRSCYTCGNNLGYTYDEKVQVEVFLHG